MSEIAPEVSELGTVATMRPRHYMYVNSYSRSVRKSADKVALDHPELEQLMLYKTLASSYFNYPVHTPAHASTALTLSRASNTRCGRSPALPVRALHTYERPRTSGPDQHGRGEEPRHLSSGGGSLQVFGHQMHHDATMLPDSQRAAHLHAPALLITRYDWGLDDTLKAGSCLPRKRALTFGGTAAADCAQRPREPGVSRGSDRCRICSAAIVAQRSSPSCTAGTTRLGTAA